MADPIVAANGAHTGQGQNLGNDFENITKYLTNKLDEQLVHEAKTAGMTADSALVQATTTAGVVKLGTIEATGLGNYDKNRGYPVGGMSLVFNEYTLRYDRALSVTVDRRDQQVTGGIAQAATGLAWTMRHKIIPEIDATRMAVLYEKLNAESATYNNVTSGAKPTEANIVSKLTTAINTVRKATGLDSGLQLYVNAELMDILDQNTTATKMQDIAAAGAINNTVTTFKGLPVTYVPDDRMKTTITLNDGFTNALTDGTDLSSVDASKFGYVPGNKSIWFTVLAPGVANAISAIENTKVVPANINQKFDGDTFYYRLYHDLIVPKHQAEGAFMAVQS